MPIRINEVSAIESFEELIPKAAAHGEAYLRAVAAGVQEYEPPVTMELDEIVTSGFRTPNLECLVVRPTQKRIRPYRTAHYAVPSGGSLRVGWYLVGGEKATGVGFLNIGAATDTDVSEVMAIVQTVHTYAVLPAIETIVNQVRFGPTQTGGFLGV